jgi:HSP20 family protein
LFKSWSNISIIKYITSKNRIKESKKDESNDEFTRQEYNYSSFCRTFALPDDVNAGNIEASYENGILKMILPKKEESVKAKLSRSISVR